MLKNLNLRKHLAGARHEELEKGKLLRCEFDLHLASPTAVSGWVQSKIADATDSRTNPTGTPDQRPEMRDKNNIGKGLREEIIGAGVERLGVVVLTVLRRKHQDGGPY